MSYFFQGFPTMFYDIMANGKLVETTDLFRAVRIKNSIRDDILLYKSYHIQDGERPDHVSLKLYGTTNYYWTFFMINENLVNTFADWPCSRIEMDNKIRIKYQGQVLLTDEDMSTKFVKGETIQGFISGATASITQKDTDKGIIRLVPGSLVGEFRDGELVRGLTSNDTLTINSQRDYKDAPNHFETPDGSWVKKGTAFSVPVSNDEHERIWNEYKTDIRVIKPEYVTMLADEFYKIINPDAQ